MSLVPNISFSCLSTDDLSITLLFVPIQSCSLQPAPPCSTPQPGCLGSVLSCHGAWGPARFVMRRSLQDSAYPPQDASFSLPFQVLTHAPLQLLLRCYLRIGVKSFQERNCLTGQVKNPYNIKQSRNTACLNVLT